MPTTGGFSACKYACSASNRANVVSKICESTPRALRCELTYSSPSGGYGFMTASSCGSSYRKDAWGSRTAISIGWSVGRRFDGRQVDQPLVGCPRAALELQPEQRQYQPGISDAAQQSQMARAQC